MIFGASYGELIYFHARNKGGLEYVDLGNFLSKYISLIVFPYIPMLLIFFSIFFLIFGWNSYFCLDLPGLPPPPPFPIISSHSICSHTIYSHITCSHIIRSHGIYAYKIYSYTIYSSNLFSHNFCTHNLFIPNLFSYNLFIQYIYNISIFIYLFLFFYKIFYVIFLKQ